MPLYLLGSFDRESLGSWTKLHGFHSCQHYPHDNRGSSYRSDRDSWRKTDFNRRPFKRSGDSAEGKSHQLPECLPNAGPCGHAYAYTIRLVERSLASVPSEALSRQWCYDDSLLRSEWKNRPIRPSVARGNWVEATWWPKHFNLWSYASRSF